MERAKPAGFTEARTAEMNEGHSADLDNFPIILDRIPVSREFTYSELVAICCYQASQTGAADFGHMSPMDFEDAKRLGGQVRKNQDGSVAILKNRAAVVRLAGS